MASGKMNERAITPTRSVFDFFGNDDESEILFEAVSGEIKVFYLEFVCFEIQIFHHL
jgi:hypothetical protein